ncbi:MAG: molybdopterin-dependent oxidoreductase [Candidatus Korobacteraceae bacterium]
MKKKVFRFLIIALACSLYAVPGSAQQKNQASITLEGLDGTKLTFTLEQLRQMPQESVTLANPSANSKEPYEGVLLRDLLEKVNATFGKKLHAEDLRDYVEVAGRDGYRVVFALAELDPSLQDNKVLVAISNEGKPLDDSLGPIRVIVPQDKRQARSVRQVTTITLRQAP